MTRKAVLCVMLIWIFASGVAAQNQQRPRRSSTRPPESNDRGLRELTAEEIPPNLNFYAMDRLYNPDAVLGYPHYPMTSYYLGVGSGGSAEATPAIGKVKQTYAR